MSEGLSQAHDWYDLEANDFFPFYILLLPGLRFRSMILKTNPKSLPKAFVNIAHFKSIVSFQH